jgi:hypothetical protein
VPVLPREERAEDQAGPDLRQAPLRALPLFALLLLSLGALAFDLSLPARLPSGEAWAEAAAALRAMGKPGDAVQIWPPWAERARLFVDTMPVLAEEDLRGAELFGVQRLWLLALPSVPHAGLAEAEAALRARGATPAGAETRFAGLSLRAWDLHAAQVARDLVFADRPEEAHEVDSVARRCVLAGVGTAGAPAHLHFQGAAGREVHVRAGIVGERAFDDKPPVRLLLLADGTPLLGLEVPRARLRQPGWLAADALVPPGAAERALDLLIESEDPHDRPLCVAAWTTR